MEFRVPGDCRGKQTRGFATYATCGPLFTYRDKTDFEHLFPDNALLHNIKIMENPLQKNLGDTYNSRKADDNTFQSKHFNSDKPNVENKTDMNASKLQSSSEGGWRYDIFPKFFGITNIITGLFNHIASAITVQSNSQNTKEEEISKKFTLNCQESDQKDSGLEDCAHDETDASPPIYDVMRHFSPRDCSKNNTEANGNKVPGDRAQCVARGADAGPPARDAMPLPTLQDPAESCQAKMAKIQDLLAGKTSDTPKTRKPLSRYRPKKIFIDPKFVQEKVVESFVPEPLGRLESFDTTDFVNPGVILGSELTHVETLPRIKLETVELSSTDSKTAANSTHAVRDLLNLNETVCHSVAAAFKVNENSHSSNINSAEDEVKDKSRVVNKSAETREQYEHGTDDLKVTDKIASDLQQCDKATTSSEPENKHLVSSCEDKLNKLKALLLERKNSKTRLSVSMQNNINVEKSDHCKIVSDDNLINETCPHSQYENSCENSLFSEQNLTESQNEHSSNRFEIGKCPSPIPLQNHRCSSLNIAKRQKSLPIHSDEYQTTESDVSSVENSPKITVTPPENGFNEIKGRFESNSSSDESFVIVFSDSPGASPPCSPRSRIPSDASDDSFIVFEDDEDNRPRCFTVDDSSSEYTSDSDSDCESNLSSAAKFSRTLADLTDESLYRDEAGSNSEDADGEQEEAECSGVLLTEEKKRARKEVPEKRVRFSEAPPQVRVMRVWTFAARQARCGNWRQYAADAERFKRRIADVDMAISWVLKPQHRNRVKFQRFMPWWHQQRRREEEERRAEEERQRKEEQERLEEERRIEEEVRRELEYERKHKKKISTQQFARNFAVYMMKMKQEKESERKSRVNSGKKDEKDSVHEHFSGEQTDGLVVDASNETLSAVESIDKLLNDDGGNDNDSVVEENVVEKETKIPENDHTKVNGIIDEVSCETVLK